MTKHSGTEDGPTEADAISRLRIIAESFTEHWGGIWILEFWESNGLIGNVDSNVPTPGPCPGMHAKDADCSAISTLELSNMDAGRLLPRSGSGEIHHNAVATTLTVSSAASLPRSKHRNEGVLQQHDRLAIHNLAALDRLHRMIDGELDDVDVLSF